MLFDLDAEGVGNILLMKSHGCGGMQTPTSLCMTDDYVQQPKKFARHRSTTKLMPTSNIPGCASQRSSAIAVLRYMYAARRGRPGALGQSDGEGKRQGRDKITVYKRVRYLADESRRHGGRMKGDY